MRPSRLGLVTTNAMAIAANGTPAKANQRNGMPGDEEHPGDDRAEDHHGAEVVAEHDERRC